VLGKQAHQFHAGIPGGANNSSLDHISLPSSVAGMIRVDPGKEKKNLP
jgi:hypothetical protein